MPRVQVRVYETTTVNGLWLIHVERSDNSAFSVISVLDNCKTANEFAEQLTAAAHWFRRVADGSVKPELFPTRSVREWTSPTSERL